MSIKSLFLHLRLHWQLILMPLFLWGFILSGAGFTSLFWQALFIFHLLFYGGATALNSYFDKDEGPVGGLWNPPAVTRELLIFAVALQLIGLIWIGWLSRPLLFLALPMGLLGNAYSIPGIRLKAHPWTSLLAVGIGQGLGGMLAGWLTGTESWASVLTPIPLLGGTVALLIILGFYPLTQVYQRIEDARRGDITFAVYWGKRTFDFSMLFIALAALPLIPLLLQLQTPGLLFLILPGLLGMIAWIARWKSRFADEQIHENYTQLMRLSYLMTAVLLLLFGWQFSQRL